MTASLVFLAVVAAIAFWWLSRQRLFSRPWLEQGILDDDSAGKSLGAAPQAGLGFLLAVIGSLFSLFIAAYVIRAEGTDWRSIPIPPLVWINTAVLVLASIALEWALDASRRSDEATARKALVLGGVFGTAFLLGQLAAWQMLTAEGFALAGNPSNSFFYLLTGLHGLHIVGGIAAIGMVLMRMGDPKTPGRATLGIELTATYWLFLLFVWVVLLALLSGGAAQFIDLCRQLLT